jgi:hypothetical protein
MYAGNGIIPEGVIRDRVVEVTIADGVIWKTTDGRGPERYLAGPHELISRHARFVYLPVLI